MASLALDDPDYDKRVAAYDAVRRDHCDCRSEVRISHDRWRELMRMAADGGSARARIDLVSDDLSELARVGNRKGNYGPQEVTAEHVEAFKQALASGDPYAIEHGTALLAGAYANFSLRDARGQAVDTNALTNAGILLACDAGYPCQRSSSPAMDQACALVGDCAADNLRDFIMYYSASPHTSELIARYQQALGDASCAETGRLSGSISGLPTIHGRWIH